MLEAIAEAARSGWPLALTMASVAVADRVRDRRRRERLNRALHELRRPLQALRLTAPGPGQLDRALAALAALDGEINGSTATKAREAVDAKQLVAAAAARWRGPAAVAGRRLELRWRATQARLSADPDAVAAALDNLLANALEHGSGAIRLEATDRAGRLRLLVADGADAGGRGERTPGAPLRGRLPAARSDPRRGHGLRVVADVAAAHGGRFAACRHGDGATAVIELPLAR